ncbi:hypothetical protein CXG81DRAFT_29116 [Caulochytrium protostelioides]|uniref:Septin-type G domain-containing protein n=1 Tax=Caulochytrium protostelioides TaxID=1555241 RepID=A0A4P9XFZ3_9FUNG|nr:hypothetical protein CXG81DRAFT_29116 [Caulochytrium protostelioides]|eukprot:RKP04090.1 hypothetical protein CXG81DRAFT_29116 [Caulochytrium protostelioides]
MATVEEPRKATLMNYVGFDTITKQIERRLLKQGFALNLMVVGRSGLGKSTLVNTLFASHLVDSKAARRPNTAEHHRSTIEIHNVSHLIEENGVRLRLSITDTPGYGDLINNQNCWEPITKYIKEQYSSYLRKELTPARERYIKDTRIHAVLFFINPSGHSLSPLDIIVMRRISEVANLIPIIGKSDCLTPEERHAFKDRIRAELDFHKIRAFPEREERLLNDRIRAMLPFAVIGSERNIVVDGKAVRGRRTRWGTVNVEDPEHCEYTALRDFLTRTHLQDLIETTGLVHYEAFRTKQLMALKESTTGSHSHLSQHAGSAVRGYEGSTTSLTTGPDGP